jgi:hypothetical protein
MDKCFAHSSLTTGIKKSFLTSLRQNSTFNVAGNTLRLIKEKMVVAAGLCDRILKGEESWAALFEVNVRVAAPCGTQR